MRRYLSPGLLILGLIGCISGCGGETEESAQQRAYQQLPRLTAEEARLRLSPEDENLIFGDATHVDIMEQLSVGPSDEHETSDASLPEIPSHGDADSFFADQGPVKGSPTPILGEQSPAIGSPATGALDSLFEEEKKVENQQAGEASSTEKEAQVPPTEESARSAESLEGQP